MGINIARITHPRVGGAVHRQRLYRAIDAGRRSHPVIWISAPAGAGKTTLAAGYVAERRLPSAWYGLDEGDADIPTFFYYMSLAAQKAFPRKRLSLPLLTPEYLLGTETFSLRYFESLYSRLNPPFVLVFDNYQHLPPGSDVHRVVAAALDILPEGVTALVVSRENPPPACVRLLATGKVLIIGADPMRLTASESRELVHMKGLTDLSDVACNRLYERTEGWAAGLVLMVENIKMGGVEEAASFGRTPREIFDYFAQEIFSKTDERSRDFLQKTALLPGITAKAAEELTGEPASKEILSRLARDRYFTQRDAGLEPVYEYHPLFREFLLSRAEGSLSPDALGALRRTAARLLYESGAVEDAVDMLRQAGDWGGLAGLIISHGPVLIKQGRYALLRGWLDSLPPGLADTNPWLLFFGGMAATPFFASEAVSFFERAFALFQEGGDIPGSVMAAFGAINSIAHRGEDFGALDYWFSILNDRLPAIGSFPDEETEAWIITSMVVALALRETHRPEMEALAGRVAAFKETPATLGPKVHAVLHLFLYYAINDVRRSFHFLSILRQLTASHNADPLARVLGRAAEAIYCVQTGAYRELMDAVRSGLELAEKTGVHIHDFWFCMQAVVGLLDCLDLKGSRKWFAMMAPSIDACPPWQKTNYYCHLARASLIGEDLDLALGHAELALDCARKAGSPYTVGASHLMMAQVLHRIGRHDEAGAHFDKVASAAAGLGNACLTAKVFFHEAQRAFDRGDEAKALEWLRKSLDLAREQGFLLGYYDDPSVTVRLLEKALEAGIQVDHVQSIIRKRGFGAHHAPTHLESWPWTLKIYTLGTFQVIRDGKRLTFSGKMQKKPLSLLKTLVAIKGQNVSQDQVCDSLWPEAEGDLARSSFRMALSRLRKILGETESVKSSDESVALNSNLCWVDAWALEHLIDRGEAVLKIQGKAGGESLSDDAGPSIERALSLYKGNFCPDETDYRLITPFRDGLRRRLLHLVIDAARRLDQRGDHEGAVDYYEKALKVDETSEECYRRLMICHQGAGRKDRAVEAYRRCERVLSSVLGIKPSRKTVEIYAGVLTEGQ